MYLSESEAWRKIARSFAPGRRGEGLCYEVDIEYRDGRITWDTRARMKATICAWMAGAPDASFGCRPTYAYKPGTHHAERAMACLFFAEIAARGDTIVNEDDR